MLLRNLCQVLADHRWGSWNLTVHDASTAGPLRSARRHGLQCLPQVTTTNRTFWRSAHLFGSDSSDSTFSSLKDVLFDVHVIRSPKGFGRLSSWLPEIVASQANTRVCFSSLSGVGCLVDLIGENLPGLRGLGDALGQHRQMPRLVCSVHQSVAPWIPWIGKKANSSCNL